MVFWGAQKVPLSCWRIWERNFLLPCLVLSLPGPYANLYGSFELEMPLLVCSMWFGQQQAG